MKIKKKELYPPKQPRIYNGERRVSSNKVYWKNETTTFKRIILDPCFTPYAENNSKWVEDLNVRSETIKLLEENIGDKFYTELGNNFFGFDTKNKGNKQH